MGTHPPGDHPATMKYTIPANIGKVRVAMGLGGKITVWNGKQGKHEFVIVCRTRKQANEVAEKINRKEHNGEIVVD
jgi:hypothetical protein